ERQRLRRALEGAGEHDRRAELADPTGEGERSACAEPAGGGRGRASPEDAGRAGPERAGGGGEGRVDRLERGDGGPDIERARDEGDGEDDGGLGERDVDPERLDRPAEQPEPPDRSA